MATKTSLLGLTKPAYTDAADIAVLNTNFDLIDKAVGNRTRVPNLLVNSWFVNPINYQGRTVYTGSNFTIDFWRTWNAAATITLTSSGIKGDGTDASVLYQDLDGDKIKPNTAYTVAAGYSDGTIECQSSVITASNNVGIWNGESQVYLAYNNGVPFVRLWSKTKTIQWMAVYQGAYDADTLPDYVVPDKRAEMIRCGIPLNPPNLLDNSWFVNPINHRGIKSGATVGSYKDCIDRWQNYSNTEGTLTFNNNGIVFQFNLCQFLNPDIIKAGMVVTAAVKWVDGTIQVAKGTITKNSGWSWFHSGNNKGRMIGVVDSNGTNYVRIDNDNGDTLVWAALYEGAYDVDTLPEYVVPNKRIEMTRCGVPLNPPNLLDNSWFVNPINQRGQTTYTKAYTIDRWSLLYNDVSTLSVTSDGLKFTSGSGDCWLLQRFERSLKAGAPYTFAVQYADGTKDVISVNVEEASAYRQGAHCIYSISTAHFAIVGRDIPNGIVIQWAALYEGAYDAETLPEYHYKGYAAELAECQRYYIKIATQPVSGWCYNWGRVTVFVPLPVTMRVASPTVSVTSASRNFYIGSTAYAAEPTGSTAVSNGISVYFSHSHTGNGQCIMPEFSAEVSADL